MKFTYQYKTSDGVRHTGTYAANSKTAVYDELRAKGIKAFSVEPAPGLLNRLSGMLGWRVGIAVVATIVAIVLGIAYLREKNEPPPAVEDDVFLAASRRQLSATRQSSRRA